MRRQNTQCSRINLAGFGAGTPHHTVCTRTQFFMKKGSGTFFVSQDVLYAESMQDGKQERTKAGYHHGDGILPFITIWYWGRLLRTKRLKPLYLLRSAQRSAPLWRRTCHPHKQTLSRCPQGRAVPPAHNGA